MGDVPIRRAPFRAAEAEAMQGGDGARLTKYATRLRRRSPANWPRPRYHLRPGDEAARALHDGRLVHPDRAGLNSTARLVLSTRGTNPPPPPPAPTGGAKATSPRTRCLTTIVNSTEWSVPSTTVTTSTTR